MGRNNKKYYKDMHQQAYDILVSMQSFGESKKEAIANGTDKEKIFSHNTYKTYWKHTKYFIKYVQEQHPEVTTIKKAKRYVNEWLQVRVDQGLSAWTIQTEAKALGKLYGISPDDPDYFQPPKRNRQDITRSRVDRARDKHFSVSNNDELIKFCKGTGLRRSELASIKGKDLMSRSEIEMEFNQLKSLKNLTEDESKRLNILKDAMRFESEYYINIVNGKGGRKRISPIVGKNIDQIVERMKNTPEDKKVWEYVNSNADIHSYRADYATEIYKTYARNIEDIPFDRVNKGTGKKFQSDVYTCRKDEAGKKLDKAAMLLSSKALGHNRIEVVANNYIRGL